MALERTGRIRKKYAYHKPSAAGVGKIAQIREAFSRLEDLLLELCPVSRETSTALTNLEAASMWAVKAVVINDPASEVDPDNKPAPRPFDNQQDVPDRVLGGES